MNSYTVIYRTGGYMNAVWHAARPVATMQEAVSQKDSIERGGRKAMIRRTSQHVALGLPVGFCGSCDPITGQCRERKGCQKHTA